MKKLLCALLCIVLATGTCVSAAGLDFLMDESAKNYSAKQTTNVIVKENGSATQNAEIPILNDLTDVFSILSGLLQQSSVSSVNRTCSADYKQMEIGVETESDSQIAAGNNVDLTVTARSGFWMQMDLTNAQAPIFKMIYRYPQMNDYVVVDLFELAALDGSTEELYAVLDYLFDVEIMKPLEEKSISHMEKNATVSYDNGVYTVHMDNAQFAQYIALMVNEVIDFFALAEWISPAEADEYKMAILIQVPAMQWLGEEGYTVRYSLTGKKKLQRVTKTIDLNVNLWEALYALSMGETTPEAASIGNLALLITEETKIMHSGESVQVTYPELTKDNSISYVTHAGLDAGPQLPEISSYAEAYCEQMPMVNGVVYVPLRALLESAYGEAVNITYYTDERIVIESDYFDTVSTRIGGDSVRIGDEICAVGDIILQNDTTYVSYRFFEYLFDWQLLDARYDLMGDYYYCLFLTEADM